MALTFEDGVHIKTVESFIRQTLRGNLDPGMRPFYRGVAKHHEQTNPSVFRTDAWRKNEIVVFFCCESRECDRTDRPALHRAAGGAAQNCEPRQDGNSG